MSQDLKRFITFDESEVPLDESDFPDGINKEIEKLGAVGATLKGVKTETLKNLDFLTLLEEYRALTFHKNNKIFQPSHRYMRLKKIFDEMMVSLRRVLQYYEIAIIDEDRSGTRLIVLIGGEKIIIEPLSWDSILVDGKKYNLFEEYLEEILRKKFYEDDDLEEIGVEQRAFFKISETIKKKLRIEFEGDYFLFRGSIEISDGYVAVPEDLKESFLNAHAQCERDEWSPEKLNYNFVRRKENRSYFIEQVDFDKALLST